jgi:hypothetical protein
LDSKIVTKIFTSKVFTSEQKMIVIENIPDSILMENKIISNEACKLLANNRKTNINSILLSDLLANSQSTEDKIKLFNKYQKDIDSSELKKIINLLGVPYSEIIKGKHPKFNNNEYNREFINLRNDYITKTEFEDKNKFIRVYTKKLKPI